MQCHTTSFSHCCNLYLPLIAHPSLFLGFTANLIVSRSVRISLCLSVLYFLSRSLSIFSSKALFIHNYPKDTKEVATNVNQSVRDLITTDDDKDPDPVQKSSHTMDCDVEPTEFYLDLGSVLTVLTSLLTGEAVATRLAVLSWVMLFLEKTPNKVKTTRL